MKGTLFPRFAKQISITGSLGGTTGNPDFMTARGWGAVVMSGFFSLSISTCGRCSLPHLGRRGSRTRTLRSQPNPHPHARRCHTVTAFWRHQSCRAIRVLQTGFATSRQSNSTPKPQHSKPAITKHRLHHDRSEFRASVKRLVIRRHIKTTGGPFGAAGATFNFT